MIARSATIENCGQWLNRKPNPLEQLSVAVQIAVASISLCQLYWSFPDCLEIHTHVQIFFFKATFQCREIFLFVNLQSKKNINNTKYTLLSLCGTLPPRIPAWHHLCFALFNTPLCWTFWLNSLQPNPSNVNLSHWIWQEMHQNEAYTEYTRAAFESNPKQAYSESTQDYANRVTPAKCP